MTLQELKMKKETLEMQLKKLNQELADTEKQIEDEKYKRKRRWKPEVEETYYYINGLGDVCAIEWSDDDFDQDLYSLGNCLKTREEAEFTLEQLKVLAELKEYAENVEVEEWDGNTKHYYLYYHIIEDNIGWGWSWYSISSNIYFSSEEQVRKAIEAIGKDRLKKYYFCV